MATVEVAGGEPMITAGQLADMYRINAKTAAQWAKEGRLHSLRTAEGWPRFFEREVRALLAGEPWEPPGWYRDDAA